MKKIAFCLLMLLGQTVIYSLPLESRNKFYQTTFDQSNGLCENTVSCILQDKLGYIWIATWDGLTRYDGNGFALFKSSPTDNSFALPSNRVAWVTEGANSDLWCIIDDRVYIFRRSNQQFEEVCPGKHLLPIYQIYPQGDGTVLLITKDGIAYEVKEDTPQQVLSTRHIDLSSEKMALYKAHNNSYSFYADKKGNVRYRNLHTEETGYALKPEQVDMVYGIARYDADHVLVTTNHGVYLYDSPTHYQPLSGWETRVVRSLCVDRQGNIWMATYPGLTELRPKRDKGMPVKTEMGQKEEFVRGLFVDSKKRAWVADKNKYVKIMSGTKTFFLSPSGTLSQSRCSFGSDVYCMLEDSKGTFWLGTKKDGLYRLIPTGGNFQVTHYAQSNARYGLNSSSIYAIAEDSRHLLWIGTHGGGINKLVMDKRGSVNFINARNTFRDYPQECNKIRCLLLMSNGVMLAGTTNGLLSFSTLVQHPKFYLNRQKNRYNSLVGNNVMQIVKDKRETLYLATFGGGLNIATSDNLLSNDVSFRQISTLDGLASDACLSVAGDNKENLWVVSEMAISKYQPKDKQIINFSIREFGDGFIFSEVQPICIDDKMMVGTTQGVLTFAPSCLRKSSFSPPVVISKITVEGKVRQQDFNILPLLTLEKDERNAIIDFSTLDFNRNTPIIYKYRLKGLDRQWKINRNPSLNLINIPPGKYTLEVVSTNGDGMWNSRKCKLTIEVKPKFGETIYAKVLYSFLLILVGSVIFVVARYIYRLRARIENIQLATNEKIEKITLRIRELIGSKPTLEDLHTDMAEEIIDKQRQFIERLMEYMNENISRSDLQVGDIAEHMGVSKTLLYTKVKEALNCTPLGLINDLRIKKAASLLEAGYNVSSVAYACGFSDPHYFSRCFKKMMGCSPSEYMANKEGEA